MQADEDAAHEPLHCRDEQSESTEHRSPPALSRNSMMGVQSRPVAMATMASAPIADPIRPPHPRHQNGVSVRNWRATCPRRDDLRGRMFAMMGFDDSDLDRASKGRGGWPIREAFEHILFWEEGLGGGSVGA